MRATEKDDECDARQENKDQDGNANHSEQTLILGGTIPTCCGPIYEWKPVPENLPNYPTIAFFGKRRTGKSTSGLNIMFHAMQDIPFGIVMSNTAYAGYFDDFIPKRFIVQGLRQDVLTWLTKRQKRLIRKYGIDAKEKVGAFIILDDGKSNPSSRNGDNPDASNCHPQAHTDQENARFVKHADPLLQQLLPTRKPCGGTSTSTRSSWKVVTWASQYS